ncbi:MULTISPECIES: BTAD domain-containing putative transcriptional regulator [unclassified Streptomyces]|uniref:BTAD domain-containing putative transcriptional regulator n=1 Tax=unclassified Streptomyces TaxID=2593676 RepID=UPI00099B7E52|nr:MULTISPECIES: BTAD domain-containing putative transcriptional regulator [unclassified Streptomyces]
MGESMQFRVLGPMEVVDDGRTVGLGGTKQRATLGFLLLNANKAVATSRLLNALWGVDEAPMTARKILQNAVYGLRGALSAGGAAGTDGTALLTRPPGYMMRVDPERVDLHRFHTWVGRGRELLAKGRPGAAAPLLRDALALWRGPALADLVENGVQWPELVALQNTRLNVMEEYFEAQLACGRHHEILAELEAMVRAEPLRERSCGQWMLAMYRCGRQADALAEYSRLRAVLVENLGLEPGRNLQLLQQSILAQDPALTLSRVPAVEVGDGGDGTDGAGPAVERAEPGRAAYTTGSGAGTDASRAGADGSSGGAAGPGGDTTGPRAGAPAPSAADVSGPPTAHRPAAPYGTIGAVPDSGAAGTAVVPAAPGRPSGPAPAGEQAAALRRQVSVVCLRTRLAPSLGEGADQELDALLDGAALLVREQVERFGGRVTASIGSVSLALFGLDGPENPDEDDRDDRDDATRAVLSALAVRDVLDVSAGSGAGAAQSAVAAAVTRGEVLLRRRPGQEGPTVVGAVLDESQTLLGAVPEGEVRVSDTVRRASDHGVVYRPGDDAAGGWQALGARGADAPGTEQALELDILKGLAQRTWHRSVPHLVTVLGEAGTGKSRLLGEFARWADELPLAPMILTARPFHGGEESPLALAGRILSAYCGVRPGDEEDVVLSALEREVRAVYPSGRAADVPLQRLRPLVASSGVDLHFGDLCPGEVLEAWREFLQDAAQRRPVALCLDDLHRLPDMALDAVEELAESAGAVPLFVVACAGQELLARRPSWAGGKSHTTTVTLDRPEPVTQEQLVASLLSAARNEPARSLPERSLPGPRGTAAA